MRMREPVVRYVPVKMPGALSPGAYCGGAGVCGSACPFCGGGTSRIRAPPAFVPSAIVSGRSTSNRVTREPSRKEPFEERSS
jgi:hypothetical protein